MHYWLRIKYFTFEYAYKKIYNLRVQPLPKGETNNLNLSGIELKGHINIELLLRPTPEGIPLSAIHDPFLTLPCPDPLARCLLGKISTNNGQRLGLVSIWLLQEEPEGGDQGLDNLAAESVWTKESALMAEMGQFSPGLINMSPYTDSSGIPLKQPPLFYCKKNRFLFHPICPWCGAVLTECRSDEALANAGLKEFSKGVKRYLWCPECGPAGANNPVFYKRVLDSADQDNPRLTDLGGMLRLWGSRINAAQGENKLPCSLCKHRQSCFTADDTDIMKAQGIITPLCFLDYYLKITDFFPMNIGQAADILAGRPVEEILAGAKHARNPMAEQELQQAAFQITSCCSNKPDPPQVMGQKLALWIDAISQAKRLWEKNPVPLMSISPLSFGVKCLDTTSMPKTEATLKTRLLIYSRTMNSPGRTDSPYPFGTADPLFLMPELSSRASGARARFLVDSCLPLETSGSYTIEGTLSLRDLPHGLEWKSCKFAICFGPSHGLTKDIRILFRSAETTGRELKLISRPTPLSEKDVSVFQLLSSQPEFPVAISLLPVSPMSADLYSLGLLGARIFLTDKEQDISKVSRDLVELRKSIFAASSTGDVPEKTIETMLDQEDILSIDHLVWEHGFHTDLPGLRPLWYRLITLILRLISFPAGSIQDGNKAPVNIIRNFEQELLDIAAELKKQKSPVPPAEKTQRDPELAFLLDRLLENTDWLIQDKTQTPEKGEPAPETQQPPMAASGEKTTDTEELEETVILGRDSIPEFNRVREMTEELPDTDLDKTIVITPKGHDA